MIGSRRSAGHSLPRFKGWADCESTWHDIPWCLMGLVSFILKPASPLHPSWQTCLTWSGRHQGALLERLEPLMDGQLALRMRNIATTLWLLWHHLEVHFIESPGQLLTGKPHRQRWCGFVACGRHLWLGQFSDVSHWEYLRISMPQFFGHMFLQSLIIMSWTRIHDK